MFPNPGCCAGSPAAIQGSSCLLSLSSKEYYDLSLLRWAKAKVSKMILESLPESRRNSMDAETLAHLVFMAFDGFAMHAHVNQGVSCSDDMIDLFCDLVLGSSRTRKATPRKQ